MARPGSFRYGLIERLGTGVQKRNRTFVVFTGLGGLALKSAMNRSRRKRKGPYRDRSGGDQLASPAEETQLDYRRVDSKFPSKNTLAIRLATPISPHRAICVNSSVAPA